jgi:hypothetical protein
MFLAFTTLGYALPSRTRLTSMVRVVGALDVPSRSEATEGRSRCVGPLSTIGNDGTTHDLGRAEARW